MRQCEIDILNFENRLQQDKRELNDLIYRYQAEGGNREMMRDKLQNLQRELEYMEGQLGMLRQSAEADAPADNARQAMPQPQSAQPQSIQPQLAQPQSVQHQPTQPQLAQPQTVQPQPIRPVQEQIGRKIRERDLEKTFGKAWMGVIASGLVFVSFVIFAVMLLPVLTDGMKIAAMFAVSLAFTAVGLAKLKADAHNKFYLALSGCGLGAVYISILVSNIYFKAFGDIVLYLLIFVWAVCVCRLGRGGSVVFQSIGQLGITVAILFGCVLMVGKFDGAKFLMLVLFFATTSIIFMAAHRQKALYKNCISLAFNAVNLCIMSASVLSLPDSAIMKAVCAVLIVYAVIQIVFCYKCELSGNAAEFGIVNIVYMVLVSGLFGLLLRNVPSEVIMANMAVIAVCAVFLVLTEARLGQGLMLGKMLVQCAAMVIMLYELIDMDTAAAWYQCMAWTALVTALLCAAYFRKSVCYKVGGLVYTVFFMFCYSIKNPAKMLVGFVFFALLAVLIYLEKRQEKEHAHALLFAVSAYCAFLVKLSMDCAYMAGLLGDRGDEVTLTCIVVGAVNLAVIKTGRLRGRSESGGEVRAAVLALYGIHLVQMLLAVLRVMLPPTNNYYFVSVPWAVVLFVANTGKILQRKDAVSGVYVGVKFTVLLVAVLVGFGVSGVPVSICHFVLAVCCIAAGFRFGVKSLRIYGLVLSMISVFKMLLADIAYSGRWQLAAGFFVAGILCFAISRIYNSIDSRTAAETGQEK